MTIDGPVLLFPCMGVLPGSTFGEAETRDMVILLPQHTRDRRALALRPVKESEHELCITWAIEIRVEWGKS